MRSPAREFLKLYPDYSALVVDLRGHGLTPPLSGSNTIQQCAQDLQDLFTTELSSQESAVPTLLCGHSLSGKIVLNYLALLSSQQRPLPLNSWILDSLPGPYETSTASSDSQSVAQILSILQTIPVPFPSRHLLIKSLIEQHHISSSIATWLGTSVIDSPTGSGSEWAFQLPVVLELFQDFCQLDLWETLERTFPPSPTLSPSPSPSLLSCPEEGKIHYVRAGRQKKWTADVLRRFEMLERSSGGRVRLHTMPNAGHWLHAEDLPGLLTIMRENNQTAR
jgi:pimeloyl-ACP methyl ester carboxylesterase